MNPDRRGYWRIVGLTTEGETITLIRDCSPFWMRDGIRVREAYYK